MNYKNKYIKYKLKYLNLIKKGGKSQKEKDKNKIKIYKQFFLKNLKDIDYIKFEITPFLEYNKDNENNNIYINLQDMNNKLKKLFIKKLKKDYNKTITKGLFYGNEIIKYNYDKNTNIISVYIKPDVNLLIRYFESWIIYEENPYELIDILKLYSWHYYYEMEQGEQHYKDGDDYIKKNEYDKYSYILDVKLYSASLYYNNKQKFYKYNRINNNSDDNFDKTFLIE
jgi:hypothetical protein